MKKSLLTLALVFMAMANALAYDVELDGVYYNLDQEEQTAQVTSGPSGVKYSGHVTIPASITYDGTTYPVTCIGFAAFDNCRDLTSVDIPNSVTTIMTCAFTWCTSLTSVEIPNSVIEIGNSFQGCSSLTSIVIPNSVQSIVAGSLSKCTSLKSVVLSNSMTTIETALFKDCTSLTSIEVPNSVKKICGIAFEGCTSLTTVILGTGVEEFENYVFTDCAALKEMVCQSPNVIRWTWDQGDNTFKGSGYESGTLYVPSSLVEDYRTADYWSSWGSIKTLEDWAAGVETPVVSGADEMQIYTIDGRKLPEMQHGLNIVNGRKIMKK